MKSAHVFKSIIVCSLIAIAAAPALAFWTDPILLDEINDYANSDPATRPVVSADENIILFMRNERLWEARRNLETGLFDQQRQLSELENTGLYAYGYWMSEDNLRLYYTSPTSSSVGQRRSTWMAVRENNNQLWRTVRRLNELEVEPFLAGCSLTSDEKTVMYDAADFSGGGLKRIFTATRNSIDEPFSNLQERYELQAIEAYAPMMTPDGLSIYFYRFNDENLAESWVGHRPSLDAPFGNFMPQNDINQYAISTGWCSQSWDGQRMYANQRWGEPDDLTNKGVFVYRWQDPPEVVAGKNLLKAIENKHQILDQLAATINMEVETMHILDGLQEPLDRNDPVYRAIHQTKLNIEKSLKKEINAQIEIIQSIQDLKNAIQEFQYQPPEDTDIEITFISTRVP